MTSNLFELPLRYELVAIQVDTPITSTSPFCCVLEPQTPLQILRSLPLSTEHFNLRMDIDDPFICVVFRVSFIDYDFICEWQMMPQHCFYVQVVNNTIFNRSIK